MSPRARNLGSALLLAACGLLMQACGSVTITTAPYPSPQPAVAAPAFPNADAIEARCERQTRRIEDAVNGGSLDQGVGEGLAENIQIVRRASYRDRHQTEPARDLGPDQAADLNAYLDDNSAAIEDAVQRRQAWDGAYHGNGGSYDYHQQSDRRIFIAELHSHFRDQDYSIDAAKSEGKLPDDRALDLHGNVQSMRDYEWQCYGANGHLDLTGDQIHTLNQALDRNYEAIARASHRHRDRDGWLSPDRPRQYRADPKAATVPERRLAATPLPAPVPQAQPRPGRAGIAAHAPLPASAPVAKAPAPVAPAQAPAAAPAGAAQAQNAPKQPTVGAHGALSKTATGAAASLSPTAALQPLKPFVDRAAKQSAAVAAAQKAGKLTAAQAAPINKQIAAFTLAQTQAAAKNGNQGVTAVQAAALKAQGDAIDKALPKAKP